MRHAHTSIDRAIAANVASSGTIIAQWVGGTMRFKDFWRKDKMTVLAVELLDDRIDRTPSALSYTFGWF
jgi:hypothetical protein